MKTLINQVANKFNGEVVNNDSVKFSFGDDDYCLIGNIIYAMDDDGKLLPGFKRVKGLLAVEHFIAARCD